MNREAVKGSLLAAAISGTYMLAGHLHTPRAQYEPLTVLPFRITMGYYIAAPIERAWADTLVSVLDWATDIWPEED